MSKAHLLNHITWDAQACSTKVLRQLEGFILMLDSSVAVAKLPMPSESINAPHCTASTNSVLVIRSPYSLRGFNSGAVCLIFAVSIIIIADGPVLLQTPIPYPSAIPGYALAVALAFGADFLATVFFEAAFFFAGVLVAVGVETAFAALPFALVTRTTL